MTDDWSLDPSLAEGDCAPVGSRQAWLTEIQFRVPLWKFPIRGWCRVFLQKLDGRDLGGDPFGICKSEVG